MYKSRLEHRGLKPTEKHGKTLICGFKESKKRFFVQRGRGDDGGGAH